MPEMYVHYISIFLLSKPEKLRPRLQQREMSVIQTPSKNQRSTTASAEPIKNTARGSILKIENVMKILDEWNQIEDSEG